MPQLPLEKDIQKTILEWLKYQPNTFVWRQNSGGMYIDSPTGRHGFKTASVDGISDIMGVYNGYPLAIEVKRPGKKPTEAQMAFLSQFRDAGGIAIIATGIEDVEDSFKNLIIHKPIHGKLFNFTKKYEIA